MTEFQFLNVSSIHFVPSHATMRAVGGGGGKPGAGCLGGSPPPATTSDCDTTVVLLPDSKTETKTRAPVASRASARGCLPKMLMVCGVAEGFVGSKPLTTPIPPVNEPELVVCCPPPETQTKAISRVLPAKRTSVGSSPTSIVRVTLPVERSTTLTESDNQLATHASRPFARTATLTGSMPTGISAVRTGVPDTSWKTESVAFGVLTASSRVPAGVMASGCTCGPSKFLYWAGAVCACAVSVARGQASQRTASERAKVRLSKGLRVRGRECRGDIKSSLRSGLRGVAGRGETRVGDGGEAVRMKTFVARRD